MSGPAPERPPLDYATPPPPRQADARVIFRNLLPASICVGALLGSWLIESSFPNGDSRNFGGPLCVLVTAPLGLVFGVFAVGESFRSAGFCAFARAAAWSFLVALAPWLFLFACVRFHLLKHL